MPYRPEQAGLFRREKGNEQTELLDAGESFVGEWVFVGSHPSFLVFWLSDVAPNAVVIEWSQDGVNHDQDAFGTSPLEVKEEDGWFYLFEVENILLGPYARLVVVNGDQPQTTVYSLVTVQNSSYAGTFVSPGDAISVAARSILTRSILTGQGPEGAYQNVTTDSQGGLLTTAPQINDSGNTFHSPPNAAPAPGERWMGEPFETLPASVIGTTFYVSGAEGESGTVWFNYAPEPDVTAVRVPLHVRDLSTALIVPLQNVDRYFWLEFEPDQPLTALHIVTIHHRQAPQPVSRFLRQEITDSEPVTHMRAFLSARNDDGTWPAVKFDQQPMSDSLSVAVAVDQTPVPVLLTNPGDIEGGGGPMTAGWFEHAQSTPAQEWTIDHNLGFFPNVTIVSSAGDILEPDLQYPNTNTVVVLFAGPVAGRAHLS